MDLAGHTDPGRSLLCKLVEIIVTNAYFLDRCDDDILDPDTAVMRLEDIASMLYEISKEERVLFLSCLEELAAKAVAPESYSYSGKQDWVDFINSFAEDSDLGGAEVEE
jgi:hypothetical protein